MQMERGRPEKRIGALEALSPIARRVWHVSSCDLQPPSLQHALSCQQCVQALRKVGIVDLHAITLDYRDGQVKDQEWCASPIVVLD